MIDKNGGNPVVDQLRALLDRLGSPGLTLAEAKDLRENVLGLIAERPRAETASSSAPSSVAGLCEAGIGLEPSASHRGHVRV